MNDFEMHDIYLNRCAEIAQRAGKNTLTNPLVGAVLVAHNRIIGEGFHEYYGGPHAEINAVMSVKTEDQHIIKEATLYVSLEPCSHFGKTPPCVHKIVELQIKKVVIAVIDPNPIVAGKGVQYLKDHGIQVDIVENEACKNILNRFYIHLQKKPFVALKWAQSSDFLISKLNQKTAISQAHTQVWVHKWRSEFDAIMIGKNTAIIDNPILDIRHYFGQNPLRIVMDARLEIPRSSHILSDSLPTLIVNEIETKTEGNKEFFQVENIKDIPFIMKLLFERGIFSIGVEGGAALHKSIIEANYWHQAYVITHQQKLFEGVKAASVTGHLLNTIHLGKDIIHIIKNNQN